MKRVKIKFIKDSKWNEPENNTFKKGSIGYIDGYVFNGYVAIITGKKIVYAILDDFEVLEY
jgi:hypothetical protein